MKIPLYIRRLFAELPGDKLLLYKKTLVRENLSKLAVTATFVGAIMMFLFILQEHLFNTGFAIAGFLLFNLFVIPICWWAKFHSQKKELKPTFYLFSRILILIYAAVAMSYAMIVYYVSYTVFDALHVYFLIVFGIVGFFQMTTTELSVLLIGGYTVLFFIQEKIETNLSILFVQRLNAMIMTFFAGLMAWVIANRRKQMFLAESLIAEQNVKLKTMLELDPMTELYHQMAARQKLEHEIHQSKRIGYPLSIIMADIDNFKKVNDQYGHVQGDRVILKVAGILTDCTRKADLVCRYGGEEFLIIMPNTDCAEAMIYAERIRFSIANSVSGNGAVQSVDPLRNSASPPDAAFPTDSVMPLSTFASPGGSTPSEDSNEPVITISGGVCQYEDETVEAFIQKADTLLYQAKNAGKNRFDYEGVCAK